MTPTLLNNRYRVLQTLAAGGFGYTFLAEDTYMPSGRRCAIKQLKPMTNDPQVNKLVQERFQREAAVLEALGEGNNQIPRLYAYFSEGGEFYLVQEWIEGDTLTNKVQKEGILSESQVTEILLSLLPVLDYVHNYRIVHRDIKPDNIIIRKRDGLPVLIDFGAVKEAITTVANPQASTTESMVIGTPGFMAAEQAAGRPIYASDLYSLGLVAVFLLTGKLPQSLEIDSGNGEILWRRDAPHCHSNLAGVVDRTIRFHPRDRFSTAREMFDTLKLNTESSEIATQSVPPPRYPIANNPGVPPTIPFKRKRYRFWHYPAAEEQKQLIAGGLVVGGWLVVAVAIAINFNRYQTTSNPVPSPTKTRSELPTIKPSPSPIPLPLPSPIPSPPLIAKPSVIFPESPEVTESPEFPEVPSTPDSTPIIAELPKVASTPKQTTSSFSQLSSPLKTPQPKPLETPTPLAIRKPLATPTPLVTPTPSPSPEKNNPTHSQIKSIPAFAPGTSKKMVESYLGNPTKQSKGLWPKTRALLYEDFVPNQVSLGYLFDVNSDRLRQTEASFYQSVELETISETLNQMLNGNITPEIQQGLARIYQRQSNRYRFTTGNHLKVAIERNERDRIYIGVWEADLH